MDENLDSKDNKIGILLVGHGSSLPYGQEVLYKLAEGYRKDSDYPVEVGFMNIAEPSIAAAVDTLKEKQVRKIIVVPAFIAHGIHTKQDIEYVLRLREDKRPSKIHNFDENERIDFDGEIIYTEPFGADSRIVEILEEKVNGSIKTPKKV
ncbi:sirohydrochlorin nickelochelatase [Methanobacterium sp.]|uniref:sirohydrochlorin nickelochelatase n=1 Tax=Methanobacterium sp. TaxID=2164 RepID=UPI003C72D97A